MDVMELYKRKYKNRKLNFKINLTSLHILSKDKF